MNIALADHSIAGGIVCPHCAGALDRETPAEIIAATPLGPIARRVAETLAARFGRWIFGRQIADLVYADDPNGGPLQASKCVDVYISRYLRPRLLPRGIVIEGRSQQGRRMRWATPAEIIE